MNWTTSQKQVLPICFVIVLAIAMLLYALLRNKTYAKKQIPFKVIGITLISLEIFKMFLAFSNGNYIGAVPVYYCSLFLIWYSAICYRKKNVQDFGHRISYLMGIIFLIYFLINPSSILRNSTENISFSFENFYGLHNIFYHMCMVLFLLLQILFKTPKTKIKDIKSFLIIGSIWISVSTTVALLTNINYNHLLYSSFSTLEIIRIDWGYIYYLVFMWFVYAFIFITGTYLLNLTNLKREN